MSRPHWLPSYLWHPLTWIAHGAIQYAAFTTDPMFGWGLLPMWYYRDLCDHQGKPPWRWPLDGLVDVAVPVAVQVVAFYWGGG